MTAAYDKSHYRKGFWALTATLFQGAMSDNVFRWVVVYMLLGTTATHSLEGAGKTTAAAGMLFALPFFLFTGLFGAISDRFSKKTVTVWMKYVEVLVMAFGVGAMFYGHAAGLWIALFLMATQSAQFTPCKYGLLPEGLPEERLAWGNGIVQGVTMIAIIIGTGLAGYLYDLLSPADNTYLIGFGLVALAFVGTMSARGIFAPPAANPEQTLPLNPYKGMGEHFKVFRRDRWLGISVIAYTYFWFIGALVQLNLVSFGFISLDLTATQISIMMAILTIGIGAGSVSAGHMSRGKIEPGLVLVGAVGIALFALLLSTPVTNLAVSCILLFGLGFSGGLFDVPVAALIQQRSPAAIRGGVITTANMVSWVGIFLASVLYWFIGEYEVPPRVVFLLAAVTAAGMGAYITVALPEFMLRTVLWLVANTVYRVRVSGRPNIPESGGALLVANHTSFLDALVITASLDRRVRFVMYRGEYDVPWIRPLAKMMGAIPVSVGGGPREVVQSLRSATESLKSGDLVCIFAEGQITRSGQLMPFRKGFDRIMQGVDAPIIPVHVDHVWGTLFRFVDGKIEWHWPNRLPFNIHVAFGSPMPSDSNAYQLRASIQELGTTVYNAREERIPLLHERFIRIMRRHPLKMRVADGRSGTLPGLRVLAGTVILARKLHEKIGADEEMVGLLVPQSVGGVLANAALTLMGKVPVNLNYTASNDAIASAAHQCKMKHVITSKAFLEQMPVEVPGEAIYLEDVMASVTKKDRIVAIVLGMLCPIKRLESMVGAPRERSIDDLATVVFSSGSEGEPKGVMLSHYNVIKNIEAALQVFPHRKGDCIMGILPFFHSFGFTATLWIVLITPHFSGVYHPNPLEARQIGELVQKYKGTILFSTSTFLQGFIRRCTAEQMATLRFVIAGAEKLAPRVRDAFKEKFGVEPLEGYGTTECAPIVSLNIPDVRAPGFYLKGTKRGSIGLPLPGISVRIVDPDTNQILQNGSAGLLMVKGPNIMKGYLGKPEKTSEVLNDGWYNTGDISTIDEDGFITITDRLARFSKIGGEMVSHTKIEDALQKVLNDPDRRLAVAGVPDENKGERLVVLHTLEDDEFDDLMSRMDETGLPNLWIPKAKAFYKVEEIPILGTGKMDLKAVKSLAKSLDVGE